MARSGRISIAARLKDLPSRWSIIIVFAAHMNQALMEACLRSCSFFYLSWKSEFDTNAKETATVLSILTSLSYCSSLIGGVMVKRFGCRLTGIIGGLLTAFGMLGSVWVQNITQLYLTTAMTGVGLGFTLNTTLVAVALHFKNGYKTANALAHSGAGTGKMTAPPLIQILLDGFGLRGALLILSAVVANIIAFGALLQKPRRERKSGLDHRAIEQLTKKQGVDSVEMASESDRSLDDLDATMSHSVKYTNAEEDKIHRCTSHNSIHASKSKLGGMRKLWSALEIGIFRRRYRFWLLCLVAFISRISYFGADLFIIPRAESIGVSLSSAAFLLSMNGIGGLLGRLGNGLLISCKLSAEIVCSICAAVATMSLLLLNAHNYVYLSVASFLLGLSNGVIYAVFIILIRRYVGCKRFSICLGIYYSCCGAAGLLGPVGAGWVFDVTNSYKTVFYVLAGANFTCCILMFLFPVLKRVEPGVDDHQTTEVN